MKINGFLSFEEVDGKNVWTFSEEPVIMENSRGKYAVVTIEDYVDVEKKEVRKIEPQFVSASEETLMKLAVGFTFNN